jgi:hypothetical protein
MKGLKDFIGEELKSVLISHWKKIFIVIIFTLAIFAAKESLAGTPKSKFYDFNNQLIDGKINFDRLIKLKKSFLPKLYETAKEKIFR